MRVQDLIDELSKFPKDLLVEFWCPDGYNDDVLAVYLNKHNVIELTGYHTFRHHFSENHPGVKVY